jgi:hypothetical protein
MSIEELYNKSLQEHFVEFILHKYHVNLVLNDNFKSIVRKYFDLDNWNHYELVNIITEKYGIKKKNS